MSLVSTLRPREAQLLVQASGGQATGSRSRPLAVLLSRREKHFVSSPSLCGSGCPVPPMTVPSQTQAFLSLPGPGDHKDQSSGALGLPG